LFICKVIFFEVFHFNAKAVLADFFRGGKITTINNFRMLNIRKKRAARKPMPFIAFRFCEKKSFHLALYIYIELFRGEVIFKSAFFSRSIHSLQRISGGGGLLEIINSILTLCGK